ncbi:hypothetical protein AVEN_177602-1 [Araneus ventricosus]|uniref:Uncharacterized protein n=1 Tax=Araneus ventricosus TaxID=182803 RepID=A0A4Y2EL65_ARAVE|nr:hypothetical protein AVEN_177602-1 [Araneus ventricosus]
MPRNFRLHNDLVLVKSVEDQTSSAGMVWKFGKEVTSHASASSSEHGSKLRGLSQDSSHLASKLDVSPTELSYINTLNMISIQFKATSTDQDTIK